MTQVDLSKYFVDKTVSLKWIPCNRPKDYRIMQKIDQEMQEVKREFAHRSAQSISLAGNMVLRNGRSR